LCVLMCERALYHDCSLASSFASDAMVRAFTYHFICCVLAWRQASGLIHSLPTQDGQTRGSRRPL